MVWNTIQGWNQGSWYTCSISPRYSERKKFNAQHFVLENTQLPQDNEQLVCGPSKPLILASIPHPSIITSTFLGLPLHDLDDLLGCPLLVLTGQGTRLRLQG